MKKNLIKISNPLRCILEMITNSLSFFIYKMGTISVLTKLQVVRRTSLTASPEDGEKASEGW